MDNLKIEIITERLFPEKFNEKLTPGQRFSAEIRQNAFTLSQPTINKNKKVQLLFQLSDRLQKTT